MNRDEICQKWMSIANNKEFGSTDKAYVAGYYRALVVEAPPSDTWNQSDEIWIAHLMGWDDAVGDHKLGFIR